MKCSFCDNECIVEEAYEGAEVWGCLFHPHKVTEHINYTYHVAGTCIGEDCCPQKHHSVTTITCYPYKVKFYRHPAKWFSIFKYNTPGSPFGDMVFKLPFHPDINPNNVKDKLSIWMPFL